MSTVTQRYEAGGRHAVSGRVPGARSPEGYGPGPYPGGRHGIDDDRAGPGNGPGADHRDHLDHAGWTGAPDEPPPMSGALVQQHRAVPQDELRADFGAHLETHYPRLVAQLYAITLDPRQAHDAVQDAYSRAWRRWADLRGREAGPDAVPGREDAVVGWVRGVAIRISARGRLLRLGRRHRPNPEETDPRTGALLEALGRLGAADRRAVVLHHMAGMSPDAVAELEGIGEQEVRRRLTRGREVVGEGMAEVLEEMVGAPVEPAPRNPAAGDTRAVDGGRA